MRSVTHCERRTRRGRAVTRIVAAALVIVLLCTGVTSHRTSSEYTFQAQDRTGAGERHRARQERQSCARPEAAKTSPCSKTTSRKKVVSFDIENTDAVLSTAATEAAVCCARPSAQQYRRPRHRCEHAALQRSPPDHSVLRSQSSMQPDEIDRAATAAQNYVDKQMAPADLVAVVSLGNSLTVNQDFTSDRALLKKVLQSFNPGAGAGLRRRHHRHDRRHGRHRRVLHRRRHRVQHLQHRSPSGGAALDRRASCPTSSRRSR